jgi:hypothetical protein
MAIVKLPPADTAVHELDPTCTGDDRLVVVLLPS